MRRLAPVAFVGLVLSAAAGAQAPPADSGSTTGMRRLTEELHKYMQSSREQPIAFLNAWQKLEPYRVAIPLRVDPTIAELFISNIKIALAVLRHRQSAKPDRPQGALPPPLPAPRSPLPYRG